MQATEKKAQRTEADLEEGLNLLKEYFGACPELTQLNELLEIGQRLEAKGQFTRSDAAEIAAFLLRDRSTEDAMRFLDHLTQRGPKTMLHRAVVGEINTRARSG